MSHKTPEFLVGVVAGEDLSASQHKAYKLDATGKAVLAAAGEGIGTIYNCAELGRPVECTTVGGGSDAVAAAAIVPGNELASDANGDAVLAVAGDFVFGIATEVAAIGQHFSYLNTVYRKA